MNQADKVEKINIDSGNLRIIFSPLDWGLGHATRSIPIIKHLVQLGAEVWIASSGKPEKLLKKEFPELNFLELKGYSIEYSKKPSSFMPKLFLQLPKLAKSILQEKEWLKNAIKEYKFDAVISDNRLGFYSKKIPSVFITHQLEVKSGGKNLTKISSKLHRSYINEFDECWVPDASGKKNLSGDLAHPEKMPKIPVKYIGILSRFEPIENAEKKYDFLFLMSGPEPQRTLFEEKILSQIKNSNDKIAFVRGLPGSNDDLKTQFRNIDFFNHLSAIEFQWLIACSEKIIARGGYTTIMDLVKMHRNAVLVPTSGQPEQEYLCKYLMKKNYFDSVEQENFDFERIRLNSEKFEVPVFEDEYKAVIEDWFKKLMKNKTLS